MLLLAISIFPTDNRERQQRIVIKPEHISLTTYHGVYDLSDKDILNFLLSIFSIFSVPQDILSILSKRQRFNGLQNASVSIQTYTNLCHTTIKEAADNHRHLNVDNLLHSPILVHNQPKLSSFPACWRSRCRSSMRDRLERTLPESLSEEFIRRIICSLVSTLARTVGPKNNTYSHQQT